MGAQAAGRGIEPPSWASKAPVFPLDDPAEAALTRIELAVSSVTEKRGLRAPLQRQRVRDLNPRDQVMSLVGGPLPYPAGGGWEARTPGFALQERCFPC
jgi:hypothetical protein